MDKETIRTLLDLLNPLHGALDEQTYDDKRLDEDDSPRDRVFDVTVTVQQERDLTQAVSILEDRLHLDETGETRSGCVLYPASMTKALREVLGMMVFELSPIAHGFRAAGYQIETKAEAEQAFVLDWLIKVAIKHGDGWRKVAGGRLAEILVQAKAKTQAA